MTYILIAHIVMENNDLYSYSPYSYGPYCILIAHIIMAHMVMVYEYGMIQANLATILVSQSNTAGIKNIEDAIEAVRTGRMNGWTIRHREVGMDGRVDGRVD